MNFPILVDGIIPFISGLFITITAINYKKNILYGLVQF